MNIQTETDRAYVVKCSRGHVFTDNGQDVCMCCPVCGEADKTMAVVGRWWATAGWDVHDLLPLMAPATALNPPAPLNTARDAHAA